MNPEPALDAIGLPRERDVRDIEQAEALFQERLATLTSSELLGKMIAIGQPGDICNSLAEYLASEQGKANSDVGLFELHHYPSDINQKPCWWPSTKQTASSRPQLGQVECISRFHV